MEHQLFLYLAAVPLLGMVAQWLAWRLRLPSILLLLGFGVALGALKSPDEIIEDISRQPGSAIELLLPIVSLSVAIILFEGGLSLRLRELKTSGKVVFRLVTWAAAISCLLTTLAARFILQLDLRLSLLLGAILVVTGPTVVGPLLRHIRPNRRLGSVLKWEGIVIDPIGAVLALLVFEQVLAEPHGFSLSSILATLGRTAAVGIGVGMGGAWILIQLVKRYWVPDFLHGVLFLTMATTVFALSNLAQSEAGLVTVTVLGIVLANQRSIPIHHVIEFKEHLRVLLISCLFIVLGSRLNPADLVDLGWGGLCFLFVLIVVVRPVAVFLSTWQTELAHRERVFLAFLAPRGIVAAAVASVFALEIALLENHDLALQAEAEKLVPVVFLVIVGSVAIYGLAAAPLARRLSLSDTDPQGILFASAEPWVRSLAGTLHSHDQSVLLIDTNFRNVAAARMEGLPAECASILSEHVREEMELSGIGRLFSVTPNDEVNALAVAEFAHLFGRKNVYQLALHDVKSGQRTSVGEHLQGRLLFTEGLDHAELRQRFDRGERFKATPIREEFTWEQFRQRYGERATVLFVVTASNDLLVATADSELTPRPGQTVIALVDEDSANMAERLDSEDS